VLFTVNSASEAYLPAIRDLGFTDSIVTVNPLSGKLGTMSLPGASSLWAQNVDTIRPVSATVIKGGEGNIVLGSLDSGLISNAIQPFMFGPFPAYYDGMKVGKFSSDIFEGLHVGNTWVDLGGGYVPVVENGVGLNSIDYNDISTSAFLDLVDGTFNVTVGDPFEPSSFIYLDSAIALIELSKTDQDGNGGFVINDRNNSNYAALEIDMVRDRVSLSADSTVGFITPNELVLFDTLGSIGMQYNYRDSSFLVETERLITIKADSITEIVTDGFSVGPELADPFFYADASDSIVGIGVTLGNNAMINLYGEANQQSVGFGDSVIDVAMYKANGWARITAFGDDLSEVGFDVFDSDSSEFLFNVGTGPGDPFFQIGSGGYNPDLSIHVAGENTPGNVLTNTGSGLAEWSPLTLQTAYDNGNGGLLMVDGKPLTVYGNSNVVLRTDPVSTDTVKQSGYSAALVLNPTKSTVSLGSASSDNEWLNYKRGFNSVALGRNLYAPSFGELAVGTLNTYYTPEGGDAAFDVDDRLFSIGNGQNSLARSNALTVLKSGYVGLGIETPENTLDVRGDSRLRSDSTYLKLGLSPMVLGGLPMEFRGFVARRYSPSDVAYNITAGLAPDGTYLSSISANDTVTADWNDVQVTEVESQVRAGNLFSGVWNEITVTRDYGVEISLEFNDTSAVSVKDSEGDEPFIIASKDSTVSINAPYLFVDNSASFGEMGFGDSTATIALTQDVETWITNPNNDLFSPGALDISSDLIYDGDSIVINTPGVYSFNLQVTFDGDLGSDIEVGLWINGSQQCFCTPIHSVAIASQYSSLPYFDIDDISAGDIVKVYAMNLGSNDDIDVISSKLIINRLK
jgi:hypothetical protein